MALPKPEPRPARRSWFELVRTNAGWHARLVGLNGEIVMTSEVHPPTAAGRRDAEAVLGLCRGAIARTGYVDERAWAKGSDERAWAKGSDEPPPVELTAGGVEV